MTFWIGAILLLALHSSCKFFNLTVSMGNEEHWKFSLYSYSKKLAIQSDFQLEKQKYKSIRKKLNFCDNKRSFDDETWVKLKC